MRWLIAAWCWMLLWGNAWAQTNTWSQQPLLQRETRGLPPNVMLTLDDSSSMLLQYLPEGKLTIGPYTVTHPLDVKHVRFHPSDATTIDPKLEGTVAAISSTENWQQKFMRSAQTNWTFYNPEVRYQPWPLASGGRMTAYPATAAPLDPMNPVVTVNLTLKKSITDANESWCFRTKAQTNCAKTTAAVGFDPGLYFVLKSVAGIPADPTVAMNYTEYSISTGTTFPKYPARTDCTGNTCTLAQEQQNFANWFTYSRSRALMVKGAIAEAFMNQGADLRLGWGRINQTTSRPIDGVNTTVIESGLRDFNKVNFFNWLYALPSNGASPWAQALRTVGEHFKRSDAAGPWAATPGGGGEQLSCRRQHHITLTDGAASDTTTGVGNVDNLNGPLIKSTTRSYQYKPAAPYKDNVSNTLADIAMTTWSKDLRADLNNNVLPSEDNPAFWQHLVTHVAALGVNTNLTEADLPALKSGTKTWGADPVDELWHAALNSRGLFKNISSAAQLTQAIQAMLAQAIHTRFETGSATARDALTSPNRLYVGSATSHAWTGDLQAYELNATGQVGAQVWSAQANLPAWSQRNIWTWRQDQATPSAVLFKWDTMGPENQNALGSYTANQSALVDYLRGDRSREGEFRVRSSVLGDITNMPLVLNAGTDLGYSKLPNNMGGSTYGAYLLQKAKRAVQVVTGGNDGMLHVFQDSLGQAAASDGREVFAYVPRAVLGNLSRLADPAYGSFSAPIHASANVTTHATYHQFFVDGPLSQTDAYITVPGSTTPQWRNIVLAPLGAGGPGVVALDMTEPGSTRVLWELGHAALGLTMAPIASGVLPNGEWVAVFGNGPFSTQGQAALMVVQLQTGAVQTLVLDNSSALGGVGVLLNSNGQIGTLYAGDMKGQVWRLDVNTAVPSRFQVSGSPLFQAKSSTGLAQPITQAPLVLSSSRGGTMVIIATGSLNTEAQADAIDEQTLYGIWDKPQDGLVRPLQRSQLALRSLSAVAGPAPAPGALSLAGAPGTFIGLNGVAVNWITQRGYAIDLGLIPGLRVVQAWQALSSSTAWVPALAPSRLNQGCETNPGLSLGLVLNVLEGTALSDAVADTNADGQVNSLDALVVGVGRRHSPQVLLRGEKVCVSGTCDTPWALPGSSLSLRLREAVSQTGVRVIQDRTWRRIINPPLR